MNEFVDFDYIEFYNKAQSVILKYLRDIDMTQISEEIERDARTDSWSVIVQNNKSKYFTELIITDEFIDGYRDYNDNNS